MRIPQGCNQKERGRLRIDGERNPKTISEASLLVSDSREKKNSTIEKGGEQDGERGTDAEEEEEQTRRNPRLFSSDERLDWSRPRSGEGKGGFSSRHGKK